MVKGNYEKKNEEYYSIRDQSYFDLVGDLASELRRSNIRYALVGGAGIQARIADVFQKERGVDITSISELEDLIRDTEDIDVTTLASDFDINTFFNSWQAINTNITLKDKYGKRKHINFKTSPHPINVTLNYQTHPSDLKGLNEKAFYECIETAEPVWLGHKNKVIEIDVAQPEYLIASKLTRAVPKDIFDIGHMLKVFQNHSKKRIDFGKVRGILTDSGKEEQYGIMESIIREVIKS